MRESPMKKRVVYYVFAIKQASNAINKEIDKQVLRSTTGGRKLAIRLIYLAIQ
jgi:hypothetical protein